MTQYNMNKPIEVWRPRRRRRGEGSDTATQNGHNQTKLTKATHKLIPTRLTWLSCVPQGKV